MNIGLVQTWDVMWNAVEKKAEQRPLDMFLLRMNRIKLAEVEDKCYTYGAQRDLWRLKMWPSKPSNDQEAIVCLLFGHFHCELWGITPGIWTDLPYGLSPYDQEQGTNNKEKPKKKERGTKKGQGSRGNEDMWEEGWRARLTALVALILLASLRLVVFPFMCLFYAFAAPLHGRIHKGSRADKGFVLFSFLLLTSYILWTLFSESYWSSRPQRHTTAEKNGVSVVLHRGVRPSQSHGTKRASGKP